MEGRDFINTLQNGREMNRPPPVFKKRSDGYKWFIVAVIGIVIIFIGSIWVTMASWTPPPNSANYQNYQHYKQDLRNWQNTTTSGNLYGRMTIEIGALGMVIGGSFGFLDHSVSDEEKKILMVIGLIGVVIMVIVSVGFATSSPYTIS